jgi:hypothetical protein
MSLTGGGDVFPFGVFGKTAVSNRFLGSDYFPDPFLDYASLAVPQSMNSVIDWSEYLWYNNPDYSQAMHRVISYFMTDIEYKGDISDDEKEKYDEFLRENLRVMQMLAVLASDFIAYGNSFSSLFIPFRRFLRCPKCKIEVPIERVDYRFKDFKFLGRCGQCHAGDVEFKLHDRRDADKSKFKVLRWSPREIQLRHHPFTGRTDYMWRIPETLSQPIRSGNRFFIEGTPWEIIIHIKEGKRFFKFNENMLYHMKEPCLSGVRNAGWGIPRIMASFKQAWYLQVLRRFDEAIALDYLVPFRVITPSPGSSREADPILHMNLGNFNSQIMSMISDHRKDPA